MDGGSSRIDPSSDNFDLLFKLIIIGDTGAAARSKCPGSQRLTRRRGHPPAHRPSRLLRAAPRGAVPQLGRRRCACALVHCVHKVARCYCCCNHGPSAPLAAPALGSCASQGALSGLGRRALREHRPAHPQPLPPLLELSAQVAASQVAADGTARVVLGPPGTGKSCLLHQFIERAFQGSSSHTIGVEFGSRLIEIGGQVIKLVRVRGRVRAS